MTSLASAHTICFALLKRTCTMRHCIVTEHGILKVLVPRKGCEVMWLVALILSDFPTTDRHGDSWRACRCWPESLIFKAVVLCRASFLYPTQGSVRATPQSSHRSPPRSNASSQSAPLFISSQYGAHAPPFCVSRRKRRSVARAHTPPIESPAARQLNWAGWP
jgi:hypothetical protein